MVRGIPPGAVSFMFGAVLYYTVDGIFYLAHAAEELAVSEAPVGYIVHTLPLGFITYYYQERPYYYYAGTFYLWNEVAGGYEVVVAPEAVQTMVANDLEDVEPEDDASDDNAEVTGTGAESDEASVEVEAIGEAEAQAIAASPENEPKEEKDRRECGGWAVYESKFDPDKTSADQATEAQVHQYNKILKACLKSRGWAVVGAE